MKKTLITTALVLTIASNANAYDRFVKLHHSEPTIEVNLSALQYLQPSGSFGSVSATMRPETIKKSPIKPVRGTEHKAVITKPVEVAKPVQEAPKVSAPELAAAPVAAPVSTGPRVVNTPTQTPSIIQSKPQTQVEVSKLPEIKLPVITPAPNPADTIPKFVPPVKAETAPIAAPKAPADIPTPPAAKKDLPLDMPKLAPITAPKAPVEAPKAVDNKLPLEMPKFAPVAPNAPAAITPPTAPIATPKAPALDDKKAMEIPKFPPVTSSSTFATPKAPVAPVAEVKIPTLAKPAISPVVAEVPAPALEKRAELAPPKLPKTKSLPTIPELKAPELTKPVTASPAAIVTPPAIPALKTPTAISALPPVTKPVAANPNQVVLPPLFPNDDKKPAEAPKANTAATSTAGLPPVNMLFGTDSDKIEIPKLPNTAPIAAANPTENVPNIPAPKVADVQINKDIPKPTALAQLPAPTAASKDVNFTFPFNETETELPLTEQARLLEVAETLKSDDDMNLTVSAYASGTEEQSSQAKRTSLARALSVRRFMLENSVPSGQIIIRPYGNESGNGVPDRVDIKVGKKVGA